MKLKTKQEIEILAEGGKRLHDILMELLDMTKPGVSTWEIDRRGRECIRKQGGTPSFLNYGAEDGIPFPASVCVSINNEVVHGIPKKERIFQEGDIVSLDIGMWYEGLATDMARTIILGSINQKVEVLVETTKKALDAGIATLRPGATIRDYALAVERVANREKLGIVRDLVGHGVGHEVHEPPQIPNYSAGASREVFEENMVIALEPMFTMGDWRVRVLEDGWTFVTTDGSLSAHFEDTVVITSQGARVLTRPQ